MSSSLLGGSLRSSTCAGISISPANTKTWIARLVAILRAVGAPDVFEMLFTSMVVTKQPPQFLASGPPTGSNGTPLFLMAAPYRACARGGVLTAGRFPH